MTSEARTDRRSATKLICPLTADDVSTMRERMMEAAARGADAVECRLDYLKTVPSQAELGGLLSDAPLEVIVTNRSKRQGGRFEGSEHERLEVLAAAAKFSPAFIDLELDAIGQELPQAAIIVSHHNFDGIDTDSESIVEAMTASKAAVSKIVFTASAPQEAFLALDILRSSSKPAIALAMGESGVLSRILAPKFSAMGTFASLDSGAESAPGQLTIEEMKGLYRFDAVGPETSICGVIGCPVAHSMSPAIHNAAFDACGVDSLYVPLLIQPGADNFNRFMDELLKRPWLDWRGLSVTIPHKENALAYLGEGVCDELACKIGAINTITIS
ncbi:MAG: type I 3-dehydroquinate dehydratase, partial [Planctomycetes bacterium]|nr:type I 3-dehydroquinate dehydratase [Planctomycetota bacterium]